MDVRNFFSFCVTFIIDHIYVTNSILLDSLPSSRCFVSPKICPNQNITFYLYTKSNSDNPVKMSIDEPASIRNANLVQGPIKFLIHGYTGDKDYSPNAEIRPEYLKGPEDVNVISIDYGPLVKDGCYIQAIENTDVVANCTAQFLEHLLQIRPDVRLSQIHFVALSLGAQVTGQISNFFTMGQIERITSLDAAFPFFIDILTPDSQEINKGDAKFIDALHTNAGMKGKLLPYADVDFYANGGTFQPPCDRLNLTCHHTFSAVLFAESINSPNGFWAHSCSYTTYFLGYCPNNGKTWELFGEYVNPNARGTYFFKTSDKPPYALPADENNFYHIYVASSLLDFLSASHCFVSPKICPNQNITFYLYTKSNSDNPVKLSVDDPASIRNANFVQGPIKFLIHGYTGDKDYFPNLHIRPEYLKGPNDVNVISIDYGPLVKEGCYIQATENTDLVANCTAQFLEHLLQIRPDVHLSQIHFIAISLGAHIAGQISNFFTMGQLERITSLDAALPLYFDMVTPDKQEINKGDAKFIDALHTNAGMKGKPIPYADVDFYANGGSFQPPCDRFNTTCHHTFSAILFAESINSPNGFWAHSCSYETYFLGYCSESDNTWELFGEYISPNASGTYFFKTSDKSPFALPADENNF